MIKKLLRNIKVLLLRLLRINDSVHGIAMGFTVGALVNFIPTFGIGPFLSAAGARLVKGNPIAGFIGGLLFLWAFPMFFYLNIVMGQALLMVIKALTHQHFGYNWGILPIWKTFLIGMLINLLFFGTSTYLVIYFFMKKYRYDILMFIYRKWKI
ncbi:DUF2062 domain-containing protein [Bacillus sp. DNRA2]|uniref:DUF2062 domain-containing protein n=1 Tax=Bacillus sp. DNRA2 TaxID=2723053 RepID=UPI00145E9823|nr:DUF2062 domain-containing protein [Bacillus sp. DNRA2]NMD71336.1 DUF2062 domain-containing protein [Bacillus sp. DNRA2]